MSRIRSSRRFGFGGVSDAEALDTGEDVVGGLGPAEGLGIGIVVIDEVTDGVLKGRDATVDATPDLTFGEEREEALDLVQPG